jgi:hypothetical protein
MQSTPSSEILFNKCLSKVLSNDASVLAADGTTPSTTAILRMDLSAGEVLVGGDWLNQGALSDTVLIGAGTWAKSFKLDGTTAVVLTADGKTYWYVLVAVPVALTPALYAIFGAEANDGAEVAPTAEQIIAALTAALGATYKPEFGVILNRVKVQRAGGVITVTATDPAVNAALKGERLAGTLAV